MRPVWKAALMAMAAHMAMYAWWIWADALLSDDYFMYGRNPDFTVVTTESFRPLGELAANLLTMWLQSAPDAVFAAKALSLVLSAVFVGLLAACFARVTGSVATGVATGLLVSTNPGIQINAIWLCTLPVWLTYVGAAGIFYALLAARDWTAGQRWGLTAMLCALMFLMLLIYQIAPFLLAGIAAAYIVLSTDDRRSIARVVVPAGAIAAVSMIAYLLVLSLAISNGIVGGRAGGALGGMLSRLATVQVEQGFFWLNLFITAKQSAAAVAALIGLGAVIDVWRNGFERALRWAVAGAVTLSAFYVPAALNDFQAAARLYSPGAIGVVGLLIAAAWAIYRQLPARFAPVGRALALATCMVLAIGSQAAGVVGLALPQHAELQHMRNQMATYDLAAIKRVHLVPPPVGTPFWAQTINDPSHDLYIVRLSTYHKWTQEGVVRFALRYLDPERKLEFTRGDQVPAPSPDLAVIDMRPASRALFEIPY